MRSANAGAISNWLTSTAYRKDTGAPPPETIGMGRGGGAWVDLGSWLRHPAEERVIVPDYKEREPTRKGKKGRKRARLEPDKQQ
jgi:hypothetical protein